MAISRPTQRFASVICIYAANVFPKNWLIFLTHRASCPDRLDREDIDESDVEKEVSEEFKSSSFFRQSIIDSGGNLNIPSEEVINTLILSK